MSTEEDLRAVLGALEREAPDAGATLAGLERLRRTRTTRRRVAGIAAVTLAVAAASLTVPDLFRDPPEQIPSTRAAEDWAFRFAIEGLPGVRIQYQGLGAPSNGERALVFAGEAHPYEVYVFPAGAYDPTAVRTGEPVEVRGKPGFYRADLPCRCVGNPSVPALAWEYAPNTWAMAQYDPGGPPPAGVRAGLTRIAAAVAFDRTTPLRVPFWIGYLPGGLKRDPGTVGAWNTASTSGELILAPAMPGGPGLSVSTFPDAGNDLPVGQPSGRDEPGLGSLVEVNLGPFMVQLSSRGVRRFSVEELTKVARSITMAGDVNDPGMWIDAARAVPVR